MRIFLATAILLLIIGIVIFSSSRKKAQTQQSGDFKSTDEMMRFLAGQAVEDAQKQNHIQLDYSVNSIESVETVLASLHEQYRKDSSSIRASGLAMAYGAYIGEAIRRSDPNCAGKSDCKWERDHPVVGPKSYPLHWGGGQSFPCAWAFRRITQGPEDNVWHKYLALTQRNTTK